MKNIVHTAVCLGVMVAATSAIAEEFSNTPKQETLAEAIAFEKHKDAAAAAQAKKDAAEAARSSRPAQTRSATAKPETSQRKQGQADTAAPKKK